MYDLECVSIIYKLLLYLYLICVPQIINLK